MFSVYQDGRGSDPVMVVGRIRPALAFNIAGILCDAMSEFVACARRVYKQDPAYTVC